MTIAEYIEKSPVQTQEKLHEIRKIIREEAPDAVETISYQMPTFKLYGQNLVHFAGWKSHIGFYPTPSGTTTFEKELTDYKKSKGSIHFELDKPLPISLIRKIMRFRIKEVKDKTNK